MWYPALNPEIEKNSVKTGDITHICFAGRNT